MDHHPFADLFFLVALLILAAVLIYWIRRRRHWLAGMALLLLTGSPLVLVVKTAVQYWAGTARLRWQSGRPRYREAYNLDPEYRVFAAYPYQLRRIWERWAEDIQQDTLVLLIEKLGPMRGSYLGPYPTRDQPRAALLESQDIGMPAELATPLTLGGGTIQIPSGALSRALADATREDLAAGGPRLNLALVDSSCLVLGYWGHFGYHAELALAPPLLRAHLPRRPASRRVPSARPGGGLALCAAVEGGVRVRAAQISAILCHAAKAYRRGQPDARLDA